MSENNESFTQRPKELNHELACTQVKTVVTEKLQAVKEDPNKPPHSYIVVRSRDEDQSDFKQRAYLGDNDERIVIQRTYLKLKSTKTPLESYQIAIRRQSDTDPCRYPVIHLNADPFVNHGVQQGEIRCWSNTEQLNADGSKSIVAPPKDQKIAYLSFEKIKKINGAGRLGVRLIVDDLLEQVDPQSQPKDIKIKEIARDIVEEMLTAGFTINLKSVPKYYDYVDALTGKKMTKITKTPEEVLAYGLALQIKNLVAEKKAAISEDYALNLGRVLNDAFVKEGLFDDETMKAFIIAREGDLIMQASKSPLGAIAEGVSEQLDEFKRATKNIDITQKELLQILEKVKKASPISGTKIDLYPAEDESMLESHTI